MRNRLLLSIAFAVACVLVFILFFWKTTDGDLPDAAGHPAITRDTRLAAGLKHSLYIDGKGQLWTWGDSRYRNRPSAVPVKVADNACAVAAGDASATSFYIACDGTLYGWGDSEVGQIGLFSETPVIEPMPILSGITGISPGHDTPFAIDTASILWTWGKVSPSRGEDVPGEETGEPIAEPRKVMELVQRVSSSATHTLALREDRSLWVWGTNDSGALATGSHTAQNRPYKADIAALQSKPIVKLATKNHASFAITEDGSLYAWGYANASLPGKENAALPPKTLPVKVDFIDRVADIALGEESALILKKDGSVWAYGAGPVVQTAKAGWTKPVHLMDDAVEIACGPRHALVLKKDGSLWSWGDNEAGQLGDGTTGNRAEPVRIRFPKPAS